MKASEDPRGKEKEKKHVSGWERGTIRQMEVKFEFLARVGKVDQWNSHSPVLSLSFFLLSLR